MSRFNYTTKTRKILADLYTPVGVYMRLRDIYPQSALMESSDYHGSENSRSFIGVHPMASIAVGHGIVTVTYPDGKVENRNSLPSVRERVRSANSPSPRQSMTLSSLSMWRERARTSVDSMVSPLSMPYATLRISR